MKAPQQSQADRHAPERRLSRRSLLGSVTAATFAAATMRLNQLDKTYSQLGPGLVRARSSQLLGWGSAPRR